MADQEKSEPTEFQVIDKRQFLNMDQIDIKNVPEEKPRFPTYVEELKTRMEETERKFKEKKKEIDEEINRTKNRLQTDFDKKLELEKQKIVLPFLEVLDNLQRALDSASQTQNIENLLEGVRMTAGIFQSKLKSAGIEAVQALDQPFDPNMEQAIGTVKVTDPGLDGIVVEEVQTGYCMNGQLLRPAQVRVGRKE